MQITVHLNPTATSATTRLGVALRPLHPGATDPELAGQYFADVPDDSADEVCSRLLEHPDVLAAYPKPAGGPPSAGIT